MGILRRLWGRYCDYMANAGMDKENWLHTLRDDPRDYEQYKINNEALKEVNKNFRLRPIYFTDFQGLDSEEK